MRELYAPWGTFAYNNLKKTEKLEPPHTASAMVPVVYTENSENILARKSCLPEYVNSGLQRRGYEGRRRRRGCRSAVV